MRRLSHRTASGKSNSNGYGNIDDESNNLSQLKSSSRFGSRQTSINQINNHHNGGRKVNQSIQEMKETMNYIKYEWPQVLEEDANPIEMAISLLDDSSVGLSHKMPEFEKVSEDTTHSLRSVVNEHYEIFNNSVGSHHYLLSVSKANQSDAEDIKQMLESTSKEIHNKSDILQELNQTSTRYHEMIEILDAMEIVNNIPIKIDQLIIDKKIHEIYDVISQGYQIAEKYNLWSLSAMTSIKNYLELQSNNLFDMIIDELQNEIYLKSNINRAASGKNNGNDVSANEFSWESLINLNNAKLSNFKNFVMKSNNLEQFVYNAANLDLDEISSVLNEDYKEFVEIQLPKLTSNQVISPTNNTIANSLTTNNNDLSLMIDLSNNYQNYYYIYQLLNTLLKLNRLTQAIEILNQSNQQEIHGLIYRSIEEIKSKNFFELNKLSKIIDFELLEFNDYSAKILKDLFSTIFIKCLIILKNQKIMNEILVGFGIDYEFKNNWDVIKNELTSLMISYIISGNESKTQNNSNNGHNNGNNNNNNTSHDNYNNSSNSDNIIKKGDELFKFDNIKFNNELISKFPDLISTEDNDKYLFIKNESFQSSFEILVPINITNMRIIIEFFLIFTSSSNTLLNINLNNSKAPINKLSTTFFETFMKLSFLPNLREYLTLKFNQIIGLNNIINNNLEINSSSNNDDNINGFNTETIVLEPNDKKSTDLKIYKNAIQFKSFFINLCTFLNTSLTYRSDLNDLVLSYINQFYLKFQQLYNDLVGNSNSKLNLWFKTPALNDLSSIIINNDLSSGKNIEEIIDKEVLIMLQNMDVFEINKDDLLDDENFNQLIYLLLTINWILRWLPNFKKESKFNYQENLTLIEKLKHDWNFLENGKVINFDEIININSKGGNNIDNNGNNDNDKNKSDLNIYLSLNSKKLEEFNEILNNFEKIKLNAIILMRYNLRLKAIYYISRSFKFNDWILFSEPGDSDEYISKFNKEIFSIENKLNKFLSDFEINNILLGFSEFLNIIIIKGSKLIKKINNNGIKRILINIFTLQQMLKNLSKNSELISFQYSSYYFNLFTINENQLTDKLKGYSKEERINLVRLLYSEKLADGNGSSFNTSKYNDLLNKVNYD